MTKGRRYIKIRGHYFIPDGRYPRYRIIMMEHLGRILAFEEYVHHINGDSSDDRIENLEIMSPKEHSKHHLIGKARPQKVRECIAQSNRKPKPPYHGPSVSKALKGKKWPEERKARHSIFMREYFKKNPKSSKVRRKS